MVKREVEDLYPGEFPQVVKLNVLQVVLKLYALCLMLKWNFLQRWLKWSLFFLVNVIILIQDPEPVRLLPTIKEENLDCYEEMPQVVLKLNVVRLMLKWKFVQCWFNDYHSWVEINYCILACTHGRIAQGYQGGADWWWLWRWTDRSQTRLTAGNHQARNSRLRGMWRQRPSVYWRSGGAPVEFGYSEIVYSFRGD